MSELFNAGLELMVIGMGIVFVFLAMLVAFVSLMSFLLTAFFPENTASPNTKPIPVSSNQEDEDVIAAISAAVHRYREER